MDLEDRPQDLRELVAHHEAGHAVAAHLLPLAGRTTHVSIRAQDLEEGDAGVYCCSCVGASPSGPDARLAEVRAHAIVALAGAEVDRRLTGNTFTHGSADYAEVRRLLVDTVLAREIRDRVDAVTLDEIRTVGPERIAESAAEEIDDELKRLYEELRSEAQALIESHWSEVEAVARALLKRQRLNGAEVSAIIESVER